MQGHRDGDGLIESVVRLRRRAATNHQYLMHLHGTQCMTRSTRRPIRMNGRSAEDKAYAGER